MNGIFYENGQWVMACGSQKIVIRYVDGNNKVIPPSETETASDGKKDRQHDQGKPKQAVRANGA